MPRTLTIRMPDGGVEFWFTDRVFEIGDTFEREGKTWVVTRVGEVDDGTGKHMTVAVRPAHESW
jgi:hypothetical protein